MNISDFDDIDKLSQIIAAKALRAAIETLDNEFGNGYAMKNPQLVSVLVKAYSDAFINAIQN